MNIECSRVLQLSRVKLQNVKGSCQTAVFAWKS